MMVEMVEMADLCAALRWPSLVILRQPGEGQRRRSCHQGVVRGDL